MRKGVLLLALAMAGCGAPADHPANAKPSPWTCTNYGSGSDKVCVRSMENVSEVPTPQDMVPPCPVNRDSPVITIQAGQKGWITALVVYCD